MRPDARGECVWFVVGIYPRNALTNQFFTVARDGKASVIYGGSPDVVKYPSGSEYVEGYLRLTFLANWYHVIIIGTQLSKVTAVD